MEYVPLHSLQVQLYYSKPPTISPGLIFFRKRFLMGLYTGGGGYTCTIFCVSVILINKYSNSDKQVLNKHTIVIIAINRGNSIDMRYLWVIVINNSDKQVGLYSGGLIFGGGGGGGGLYWEVYGIRFIPLHSLCFR